MSVALDIPRLFENEEWQHCLEDYLLSRFDTSESYGTFRIYLLQLRRFFTDPARTPDDYTMHEVNVFLRSGHGKNGKPVAPATFNQRQAVLAGLYKFAARYPVKRSGRRPEALFPDLAPTAQVQRRKLARNYKAFTAEEIERFFHAIQDTMIERIARLAKRYGISFDVAKFHKMDANHQCGYIKQMTTHSATARRAIMYPFIVAQRDRAFYWLALTSARRRDELRLLQWQDIEKTTFVEHNVARSGYLFSFHGKGHASQRDACEMAGSAYTLIERYLTHSGRLIEPEDYVFCGAMALKRGGRAKKPLADSVLQNMFRRYADRAGIPANRTIHSFRHASARLRYESGADIRAIQRTLRHKNLSTTSDYLDVLLSPPDPEAALIERQFAHIAGRDARASHD